MSTSTPTTRHTADERRDEVIAAAVRAFAAGGYAGTSTESIARAVGVSQPYLFQLFGTKKDLFLEAIRHGFGRTRLAFEEAGRRARAEDPSAWHVLHEMGNAYCALLRDRELLLCQLQAYAACGDPAIRKVVGEEFHRIYQTVGELSGADDAALEQWFAMGMLMNTAAAIGPEMAEAGDFSFATLGRIADAR
jgi:AcrR family transcriptional regulator